MGLGRFLTRRSFMQPIISPFSLSASEEKSSATVSNQKEECDAMENCSNLPSGFSTSVLHENSECHFPGENSEDHSGATQQLDFPFQSEAAEISAGKIAVCDWSSSFSENGGTTDNLVGKIQNLDSVCEKGSFEVETFILQEVVTGGVEEKEIENPGKCTRKEHDQKTQLCAGTEGDGKEAFGLTEELLMKEADPKGSLEMKKKLLLEELEALWVPENEIHREKVNYSSSSGGVEDNCSKMVLVDEERIADQQNDPEIMNVHRGSKVSLRNSLKIEVIDETALVEPVNVYKNGNGESMGIFCPARSMQMELDKKAETGIGGKKSRRARRRAREAKILDLNRNLENVNNPGKVNGHHRNEEGNKMTYSREEMEALRFVSVPQQRKLWKAIFKKLMPDVAREYSSLTSSNHLKKIGSTSDPVQHLEKRDYASKITRETGSESLDGERENMEGDSEIKMMGSWDLSCSPSVSEGATVLDDECREESDDDRYYNSIQRPAFLVEGEPNFDSGPPEDGLEYLRRVRWEASHIPNVTVANVDRDNFKKEQSIYMPVIPEIADCPKHLLPSKQWEDAFLADFSELRKVLSAEDPSSMMEPGFILHEKIDSIVPNLIDHASNSSTEEINSQQPLQSTPATSERESCSDYPSLSAILKMDSVFRVSSLRKRISSVETQSNLLRIDCIWLFALSAAVDTPLDADTCAAFRSLLRKCASLRAEKAELDDEVIMLNILATVAGRYFGQSEI